MAQKIRMKDLKYRPAFQPLNRQQGWWAFENKMKSEQDAKLAVLRKK